MLNIYIFCEYVLVHVLYHVWVKALSVVTVIQGLQGLPGPPGPTGERGERVCTSVMCIWISIISVAVLSLEDFEFQMSLAGWCMHRITLDCHWEITFQFSEKHTDEKMRECFVLFKQSIKWQFCKEARHFERCYEITVRQKCWKNLFSWLSQWPSQTCKTGERKWPWNRNNYLIIKQSDISWVLTIIVKIQLKCFDSCIKNLQTSNKHLLFERKLFENKCCRVMLELQEHRELLEDLDLW